MRGLKYISWADTTGYAVAAKAYVRGLIDAGIELTWTPMLPGADRYQLQSVDTWPEARLNDVCNRPIDYDTVLLHSVPEYFPALIEQERREGRRILGYTVWELEMLPAHWPAILNRLDAVLVPCHWNVEVFRRSGVRVPIHVVPHLSQFEGIAEAGDAAHASLQARLPRTDGARRRLVFYTVGYWSNRKAPYLALEAYWKAFDANDPVLMIVKTSRNDITRWHRHWRNGFRRRHPSPIDSVARLARRFRNPAPVAVIADETLSDAEMLALHELGDCFVSLTRTEGWGLGAFEAARLGKPVVITGYGGQLDYLDPEFSHLIDYTLVPVHEPTWSASYKPSDHWAEPSVEQAARQLRAIFNDPESARRRAHRQAARLSNDFSRGAVIDALIEALA
ncbi:glycosyltransferase [Pseudomonas sp.]|uniref:glycosyltransferase n=1 Tax=Pseudomonas sp. TaxID=306 RepID=UPI0028ADCFDA|nr:glycosyltransferase [Pseudomonas sp.]